MFQHPVNLIEGGGGRGEKGDYKVERTFFGVYPKVLVQKKASLQLAETINKTMTFTSLALRKCFSTLYIWLGGREITR